MKRNILFFHHVNSDFVLQDLKILNAQHSVTTFLFKQSNIFALIYSFIKQFILILKTPKKNLVYLSEFASYHSWLPSVFCRFLEIPHIIFLHGADVNIISSIGYGHNFKRPLKWFNLYSLNNASHLVPVSSHLIKSDYNYIPNNPPIQGLIPLLKKKDLNAIVIPNGVDLKIFKDFRLKRKDNSFLVVCSGANNTKRAKLKGVDLVFALAPKLPQCTFTIVGYEGKYQPSEYPKNIRLYPLQSQSELVKFYNQHQFIIQLSLIESFGLALSEAMLCGCIPIVSNVAALLDIENGQGYVLKNKNIEDLYFIMLKAISEYNQKKTEMTSTHITMNYSIKQREEKILKLIKSL
jgi:glycosyltransferase involved in cell wall biosynthesis